MNRRDQYELMWWRLCFQTKLEPFVEGGSDYYPNPGDKLLGRRFRLVEIKPEESDGRPA